MRIKIFALKLLIIIALLTGLLWNGYFQRSMAQQIHEIDDATFEEKILTQKEELNVGELIISHVVDAHEWHLMTLPNGKAVAVYLPMILFHQGKLYCFSSKHLYHNSERSYKGFEIEKGKVVFRQGSGELSAAKVYDFSITKVVVGIFLSCAMLIVIFLRMVSVYAKRPDKAPKGLWNLFEMGILFVRDDIAKPNIGKHYEKYMPFLLIVFFFILFNNLIGQVPGMPNVSGNIAITLTLAMFTFVIVTFSGNRHYWKEIFNPDVPWLMKFPIPLMPFIEFFGILFIILASYMELLNYRFMIMLFGLYAVYGGILSLSSFSQHIYINRFKLSFFDIIKAMLLCVFEFGVFRHIFVVVRIMAFLKYQKNKMAWGKIKRV